MKQFFGGCLGGCLGTMIGIILSTVIIVVLITSSALEVFDKKQYKVKINEKIGKKPVLKIKLIGEIKDTPARNMWNFNFSELMNDKNIILSELIRSIEVAAKDENIQGIYIRLYPFNASIAQLEELRKALQEFKKTNKWIYVYADNYFQSDYYLASIADKIILNPQGTLLWKGIAMQPAFYKKALEKLDIQVQVFRHGKFKSAVEPFILDKMSDENRQQMRTLIGSIWKDILTKVSKSRNIPEEKLNQLANNLTIRDAKIALNNKMIDLISDEQSTEEMIQKLVKKDEKNTFVDYHKYKHKSKEENKEETESKIAVIYASGQIIDYIENEFDDDVIVPSQFLKTLKKVEEDERVKAVVLRVNSPGGSAFASETIWQAIKKLKAKKPVIVSFGEVAASGGYYISSAADYIFTDNNTITGSIGVFGMLLNIQNLLQKDLGINTDTVKTNTHSDFISIVRPVHPKEYDAIMHGIEAVYNRFLDRVREGRKLEKFYIDSIGQGRIWSGKDAVNLKLADKIGTLKDAIEYAAKKVHLKNFEIIEYPKPKDPFEQIFENLNIDEDEIEEKILKANTGKHYKDIMILKKTLKSQQVNYLALMPYQIELY